MKVKTLKLKTNRNYHAYKRDCHPLLKPPQCFTLKFGQCFKIVSFSLFYSTCCSILLLIQLRAYVAHFLFKKIPKFLVYESLETHGGSSVMKLGVFFPFCYTLVNFLSLIAFVNQSKLGEFPIFPLTTECSRISDF